MTESGRAAAARGQALLHERRFAEAEVFCARAIELGHRTPGAWSNFGAAQQALGQHDAAVTAFRTAIELAPDSAELRANFGNALIDVGDIAGALAACEQAIALDPALADAYIYLGRLRYQCGQYDAAIACFRHALTLRPASATAHYNLGTALLAAGHLLEGFTHYEHRLRRPDGLAAVWPGWAGRPLWDGAPLPGRTLLVLAEQGMGDIIQFARFVPPVRALCGRVILRVPAGLARLLAALGDISADDTPLPPFDAWCPVMSLPHCLGTTIETIPCATPYLYPDPARVEHWRATLPATGLRAGIGWQGNPKVPGDGGRSVPLTAFAPLAALPGVQLISLQRGHGLEQIATCGFAGRILVPDDAFDAGPDAFADTAALMMSLDVVITTDTVIAHLAGALGRPVWVLLRRYPEWRWLTERGDSSWYLGMKLFRQEEDGQWGPVFDRVEAALAATKEPSLFRGILAPLSPADLIDRIAILEIKVARLSGAVQRDNALRELRLLQQARDGSDLPWTLSEDLRLELNTVHGLLWEAETVFRRAERRGDLGADFVAAAQRIIQHNGRRADLKRAINDCLGSCLFEEKEY